MTGPISIQIDGQTWYCANEDVKAKLAGITDKEKQRTALQFLASFSSPQVSLDENAFVDTSEMVDDEGDASETSAAETANETGEIQGFSQESYDKYIKGSSFKNMSNIDENSTLEDVEAALDEITKKTDELTGAVDALEKAKTPKEIEDVFSDITNLEAALNKLGTTVDTNTAPKAKEESTAEKIGKGLLGLAIISNPIGWIAGAVALGVKGVADAKKAEAIENVKTKITEANTKLQEQKTLAAENVSIALEGIAETAGEELAEKMGAVDGQIRYAGLSPDTIGNYLDSIAETVEELEKYVEVCEKYGIDMGEFKTGFDNLKGTDDGAGFAQEYLNSYAESVTARVTGEVVGDTANLTEQYEGLKRLFEKAQAAGLDTTALEGAMQSIENANQTDVTTAAEGYTNGAGAGGDVVGNVTGNMDAAVAAAAAANGVTDGATAYGVSTDALNMAEKDLTNASQEEIDNFVKSIDTSGATSLAGLSKIYDEVNDVYTRLEEAGTMLDTSALTAKLDEIKETMQKVIDDKQAEFENLLNAATTPYECADVQNKITNYISKHSYNGIDLSGMAALSAVAAAKQQELLDKEKGTSGTESTSGQNTQTGETGNTNNGTVHIEIDPVQEKLNNDVNNLESNLKMLFTMAGSLLDRARAEYPDYELIREELSALEGYVDEYEQTFYNDVVGNLSSEHTANIGPIKDLIIDLRSRIDLIKAEL